MTEEIIIDGVNVAGCEFFNDCECKLYKQEYWELTDTTFDFCKEHPLCEYKATAILERLEQENKELKSSNKKICEDWEKEIKVYWNALEEIRVIADDTFKVCDDDCGNARKIKLIIDKINEVLNES